ncbi:hypothetical protein V1477_012058 [Vespula maculifrons]|uniref:Uncharacterized protein n=1 Tax=Vespula maculifrons TaxID=7453 RepID=A0ABD2BXT5_VESMC
MTQICNLITKFSRFAETFLDSPMADRFFVDRKNKNVIDDITADFNDKRIKRSIAILRNPPWNDSGFSMTNVDIKSDDTNTFTCLHERQYTRTLQRRKILCFLFRAMHLASVHGDDSCSRRPAIDVFLHFTFARFNASIPLLSPLSFLSSIAFLRAVTSRKP